jgi:hypothetical protein
MTGAAELEKVTKQEVPEEWKDEYQEELGEYTEIVRVARGTSINGCVGYIASRFSHVKTGSFRIEALGTAIPRTIFIVEAAQKQSKDMWGSGDYLKIEKRSTSTVKGEKANIPKVSILLSKYSFIEARRFLRNSRYSNEFNYKEIISLLGNECRIEILKYLEILSEDYILKNYFRCLCSLLTSSKDRKRLIEKIKKESNQYETIDRTRAKGFGQGIYDLYGVIQVIDVFLSVKDIVDMVTLENTVESYYRKIAEPEHYTKTIYDKIKEISESIKKFRDAENPYYKLYYLSEARILLEDINSIVGSHFVEPFKTMYLVTFDRWRNILSESKEKTKINPEIKIMPEYESKPRDGMISVKMSLNNVGFVEIGDIELRIIETEDFRVVDENPKIISAIPPNRKKIVYFKVNMAEKRINIRYILKYYTQGKKFEKEESFAIFPEDTYEEFKKIPNPYVFGRCLKPGKGDVFVGRDDIYRFIEQNFERSTKAMVFIIHGLRRTGKTSFLNYLPEKIQANKEFIYIDMQLRRENSLSDFLNAIIGIISRKMNLRPVKIEKTQSNPYAVFEDFLEHAIKESRKGIVLMFDEFELLDKKIKDKKSDIDEGILDFIRGILHKEDEFTLIFAGTFDESEISSKWKILFNVGFRISITSLRETEAKFLIENPVKEYVLYSDIARDRLIDLSGRNPYYLQGLCRMMIDRLNIERRNNAGKEDIEEIQNEAISALMYNYSHFWENLSPLEKRVCKTLAMLQLKEYDVAVSDIENCMEDERIDHGEIRNIIEELFRKEILEKYSYDIPRYRFAIELLAHQINRFGRY